MFLKRYGHGSGQDLWQPDRSLLIFYAGVDEATLEFLDRIGPQNATDTDLSMQAYRNGLEQVVVIQYWRYLNLRLTFGKTFAHGARNFLIIGPPALEESPRLRLSGISDYLFSFGSELVDLSGRIAFMAQSFAHDHPEATVFFFNNLKYAISTRSGVRNFPETAQIKREEGYCFFYSDRKETIQFDPACKNELTEFYWRDDVHHTEPYNRLMGRLMVGEMMIMENALPYEFY